MKKLTKKENAIFDAAWDEGYEAYHKAVLRENNPHIVLVANDGWDEGWEIAWEDDQ